MTFPVAPPRLLPLTIAAMVALLTVKSIGLVRAAMPAEAGSAATATSAPATQGASASTAKPAAEHVAATGPDQAASQTPVAAPVPATEPPISDSERALLLDLRKRRGELDAREAVLATRQSVLAAAEKRLAERVTELTALQARLEALERARTERDEANWRGLVKTYETMKPRDAATIFNDLDMPVLLQVFDRMKESKAAAVMAAMAPDRARLVTAGLAQLRLRSNAAPAQPAVDSAQPLIAKPATSPSP